MTHFLACTVVVCTLVGTCAMAVYQMAEDAGNRSASDLLAVVGGITVAVGALAGIALAVAVLY